MASTNPLVGFNKEPEKPARELSFKEQLDKAADDARQPPEEKQGNESLMKPIIEKVTEYVPAATKVLGDPKQEEEQATKEKQPAPGGPPERPLHDDKIEKFVRDQHRSKGADGKLM